MIVNMFPIIWRYLLSHYFKVMGLCTVSFIAVLLTARLDEIAHFAVLSPTPQLAALFILLQIPYILPIVIPVSCLISSILLVQRLSKTHELTAFRACGISLKDFLTPILFSAVLVGIFNFFIVSELATYSHYQTGIWKEELRSMNPLLLLRNKRLMRVKGGFFNTIGESLNGKIAEHAVLALPNKSQSRISLFLAEELIAEDDLLEGKHVSLITSIPSDNEEDFDQLIIENMSKTETLADDFAKIMQQYKWVLNNDYLTMDQLLARMYEEQRCESISGAINRCYTEIIRRFSLGIAAFTFTLMGLAFGISISRTQPVKKLIAVILLAGMYITAFFLGKGLDHNLIASSALYLIPHFLIITFSIVVLYRINKGIEGR